MSQPVAVNQSTSVNTFQGVCYADAVATPPLPVENAPSSPPQDTVDDCNGGMPHWYCASNGGDPYAAPTPWNDGQGPTRQVRGEDSGAAKESCLDSARDDLDGCLKTREYSAASVCENTPTRAGRDVDMRPIRPGDEKACQDHWVYGTDGRSVNDTGTDGTHASDAHSTAKQVGGKGSASVKLKAGTAEATLGAEGNSSATWTDQHTDGKLRFDAHTEGRTQAARPGTADKCYSDYREQAKKCDSQR